MFQPGEGMAAAPKGRPLYMTLGYATSITRKRGREEAGLKNETSLPRLARCGSEVACENTFYLLRGRRRRFGHRLAAMARVASHVHLAIRELGVDLVDHLHHLACDKLLGVLVAGTILDM